MSFVEKAEAVENEINTHGSLISQIKTVLETKSGGTSMQEKFGSFTIDENARANVYCGFSPDIVVMDTDFSQGAVQALTAPFFYSTDDVGHALTRPIDYGVVTAYVEKNQDGFSVYSYMGIDLNNMQEVDLQNRVVDFLAVKFT